MASFVPVLPCFVALPDSNDTDEDAGDTEDDVYSGFRGIGGHHEGFIAGQEPNGKWKVNCLQTVEEKDVILKTPG